MSLFSRASSFLNRAMKDANPVDVVYTRGAISLSFTASIGRTVFATNVQQGARIEFGEIDFLIEASDLSTLTSPDGAPALGDRIACTLNGNALTFECKPIAGEPSWRFSDPQRTRFRVHMKRVI